MTLFPAKNNFFEEFSESFGSSQIGNTFWYVLLLCLGAALLILFARRIFRQFFIDREGRRLFNELCSAHKLNAKERRFLLDYALALGLKNRCVLFVKSGLFDRELTDLLKERGLLSHLSLRPQSFKSIRNRLKNRLFLESSADGALCEQTDNTDKAT